MTSWLDRFPRRLFALASVFVCLSAALAPARAEGEVDLRLVLAVDASGSVNEQRFELQKRGYSEAFRHPRVLKAVQSGAHRAIAVAMMQWTGPALQVDVVPWTRIADAADLARFADAIDAAPRRLFSGGTSISGAIDRAVTLLAQCPFRSPRSVIDISGDGGNNRGRPAHVARDEAVAAGIVINGLPILEIEPQLDEHYLHHVIGGPNSFVIPTETFEGFADAILKKLIIEIADLPIRNRRLAANTMRACDQC